MTKQTVWVVYEPQDYQRANIIGVFTQRIDAQRQQRIARDELVSDGNVNTNVEIDEVVLE